MTSNTLLKVEKEVAIMRKLIPDGGMVFAAAGLLFLLFLFAWTGRIELRFAGVEIGNPILANLVGLVVFLVSYAVFLVVGLALILVSAIAFSVVVSAGTGIVKVWRDA